MSESVSQLSQLEKLRRQKEIIEARIQKAEARYKQQEKKQETRRKILIGAYFLDKLRTEGRLESIKPELDKFLTRNSDRVLFGLTRIGDEEMVNRNDEV